MYDFKAVEEGILDFWIKNNIYSKVKNKNKDKNKFYYLDGPPYTSGRIHLGHAWGKALRDALMRYKRMRGFDVWDRSGFDMHGLPTEHAVEAKFGIKNKDEIEKFGVLNYVRECEKLSLENLRLMVSDFERLGVWMDWENPYMSINNSYIEGVWWLVKTAHDKGRLYEGLRTMHWCGQCGSALAKHELEYQNVKDKSVFLKFKVVGSKNEYLIIWTTTSWTISFNLAVMVNPLIDYVRCKVDKEVWIVAKPLANVLISGLLGKKFEVIEEFKGDKLDGLKYEHPFSKDIAAFKEMEKKHKRLHTVVLSEEYVDASSGTGLVHCAPGCGPEDYEVGHKYGLPPFNTLNEEGYFDESMGKFSGLRAKQDDKKFIEYFRDYGFLLEVTDVEHDYAHCWRCHAPVVFRATSQWFFKIEDLKENMKKINEKTYWVPDWAGSRQFQDWLDNLRDNSITKQRYWGTPLPVWKCEKCGNYVVIGSAKELKKYANNIPENLHKPWIDSITFSCKCRGTMRRIPDVIDVWVDAGCASWLCLDFPQRDDLFKKWYPADFIVEGKDQIRGWFNILLVASMIGFGNTSYKSVYMHGFINDALGRKMSKSLKNYIMPEEVVGKYGADTLRYYMMGGTNAGVDINYNFDDMKVKYRNLGVLYNLNNFVISLAEQNGFDAKARPKKLDVEEKYMLSRLNGAIKEATELYDGYYLDRVPWAIEKAFLDLSRNYIQFVRDKAATGNEEGKKQVFYVCFNSLLNILKMFSTVAPFVSEYMYQEIRKKFRLNEESICLYDWPEADVKLIDKKLENSMAEANAMIQAIMAARDKEKINVRWPLSRATIYLYKSSIKDMYKPLLELISRQTNIKKIIFNVVDKSIDEKIEGFQFEHGYVVLDTELTKELEEEGYARELMRRVQALRKEAGLQKQNEIELYINIDVDLSKWKKQISERCGAKTVKLGSLKSVKYSADGEIRGKKFEIGFN